MGDCRKTGTNVKTDINESPIVCEENIIGLIMEKATLVAVPCVRTSNQFPDATFRKRFFLVDNYIIRTSAQINYTMLTWICEQLVYAQSEFPREGLTCLMHVLMAKQQFS